MSSVIVKRKIAIKPNDMEHALHSVPNHGLLSRKAKRITCGDAVVGVNKTEAKGRRLSVIVSPDLYFVYADSLSLVRVAMLQATSQNWIILHE